MYLFINFFEEKTKDLNFYVLIKKITMFTTYVARASDGLILAESHEETTDSLIESKRKVKKFLSSGAANKMPNEFTCTDVGSHNLK